ncbi:hypothetical protein BX600DRAFT_514115 [Xylariales sp. PMI_506]|nr:hypothetical protein BX600DRAFT_514115 [Xylariales sp. PMI_506]
MAKISNPQENIDWDHLTLPGPEVVGHVESRYSPKTGRWSAPVVVNDPYIRVHGLSPALNYGQQCYEGLKAFRTSTGDVSIFRPWKHAARMIQSTTCVSIPKVPEEHFISCVKAAVVANSAYIPPCSARNAVVYVRPVTFCAAEMIELSAAATEYTFAVYVKPTSAYHGTQPLDALVLDDFDRAAPRGTGRAKVGGNYAPVLRWSDDARRRGYGLTLHLDSATRSEIEEFSTSGFLGIKDYAGKDGKPVLVVPDSMTVIDSVTSDCCVTLAKSLSWTVEKRRTPNVVEGLTIGGDSAACVCATDPATQNESPSLSWTRLSPMQNPSTVTLPQSYLPQPQPSHLNMIVVEHRKQTGGGFIPIGADDNPNMESVVKVQRHMSSRHALWCHVREDGKSVCDDSKITKLLPSSGSNDHLIDILQGRVISGQVWPLLFDEATAEDSDLIWFRSLPFYSQLLADPESGAARFRCLTEGQRRLASVGIRDLFLANWRGLLDDSQKKILQGMCDAIEETVSEVRIEGMAASFHPSITCRTIKFVESINDVVDQEQLPFFAQVMEAPRLYAVFVDPAELSFHNFENIVPIDRWIETRAETDADGDLELPLSLSDTQLLGADQKVWTCKLAGKACDMIQQIPKLDLYVPPLNKSARGGFRFIFHSDHLSKALTEALKNSDILETIHGGKLMSSFRFLNYVFRCNKFEPHHGKFLNHRDTPYYDAERRQISKYTLLLYLTAGSGNPVLRVGDVDLEHIEEMTCVIFDQSLEHEGAPYKDGDKIFIRTELVFEDRNLKHNNQIASLFSEACYMTGHDIFDDAIARHSHECFERANSLHWAMGKEPNDSLYLHKCFQGINFVTNGFNYWFPKNGAIDIKDCGMIAVLDYFNCKIGGKPFRSLCDLKVVRQEIADLKSIWKFFEQNAAGKATKITRLQPSTVKNLFKTKPDGPFMKRADPWAEETNENEIEEDQEGACCPFHSWQMFDAWEDDEVRKVYDTCCTYTKKKIFGTPLVILNREVLLNEDRIKVSGDKLYFLRGKQDRPLPPINFAACWNGVEPTAFIGLDKKIAALELLLAPIQFCDHDQGFQLMVDFFRNDWVRTSRVDDENTIAVPTITNDLDLDEPTCHPSFLDTVGSFDFDFTNGLKISGVEEDSEGQANSATQSDTPEPLYDGAFIDADDYSEEVLDDSDFSDSSAPRHRPVFLEIDDDVDQDDLEEEDRQDSDVADTPGEEDTPVAKRRRRI